MLTKLVVRNFKRFDEIDVELGDAVVLIGPNNSGKTTALQALALWDIGVRQWQLKRRGKAPPEKRPGVTINRRDLIATPVPSANLLWRDLHVRDVQRPNGKQQTANVRIEIVVSGVTDGRAWECGLEFDYANAESFYCRPLRLPSDGKAQLMPVPEEATHSRVCLLPPMSGLADREFVTQSGEIGFLIGQGRTAEVLRNLCYQLSGPDGSQEQWQAVCDEMKNLFGVTLQTPDLVKERSEIIMRYRDRSNVELDLSSAGRGLQQTLLLLAYLSLNPGSVLLLDEPDAHLEILRQRQIYQVLTETARKQGSQVIAASHSEVLLNEAADRDVVVAFVGKPHRIDDRGNQVLKSLRQIGFDQYYQAEQQGWCLYLEGSTDLAILQTFAAELRHSASECLQRPFVTYVENLPKKAADHFYGLREAKPDLVGFVLCDRLDTPPKSNPELVQVQWQRREIENYLCQPDTLRAYARTLGADVDGQPLFASQRVQIMDECIHKLVPPVALENLQDQWWLDQKASDSFLDRLFQLFFVRLELPNLMRKTDYHQLARFVPADQIAPEVGEVLDAILSVAQRATPA